MTRLTVRVKNDAYAYRERFGYHIPEYNDYTGDVYPNPKWVSDNNFCLTTNDSAFPFRIIDKESIIHGWLLSSRSKAKAEVQSPPTTYQVESKGKTYLITKDSRGKLSCNCTGFSYRKTCSHVKGIINES
jgi:hypothetical protein